MLRDPLQRGLSVWGPKGFFIGRVSAISGECFLLQSTLGEFWLPQEIISSIADREVRISVIRDDLDQHRCPHGSHFPTTAR